MLTVPGFDPRPYSAAQRVRHPGSLMSYDEGTNLGIAFEKCFGKGRLILGGFLEGKYKEAPRPQVKLTVVDGAPDKLAELLQGSGRILSDTHYASPADKTKNPVSYRIARRREVFDLCHVTNQNPEGAVSSFNSKKSIFRAAAGKVDPSWVARFDKMVVTNTPTPGQRKLEDYFTAKEFVLILAETRNYAVDVLNSVNVPVTDANVSDLLELMFLKNYRVIRETFQNMPYLKVHNSMDKNLAVMLNEGWDYLKILTLNVAEMYPQTKEELEPWSKAPTDWLVTFVA